MDLWPQPCSDGWWRVRVQGEAGKRDAPAVLTMSLQVLGCGPLGFLGGFVERRESSGHLARALNWGLAWARGPRPGTPAFKELMAHLLLITWFHGTDTDTQGDIQLPMPPQRVNARPPGAGHLHHRKWQVGLCWTPMGAGGSRTGLGSVGLSHRLPKSL